MPQNDDQFDADWSGSDEPPPAPDSKKGFADRAKQEDIRTLCVLHARSLSE